MIKQSQWLLTKGFNWLRNQDLIVLLSMLAIVLGLWIFIELADEIREGSTPRFDDWMIKSFRNPNDASDPIGPEWLEEAMRDLTALGGVIVMTLVTLSVMGFVALRRQFHALGLLIAAVVGGGLLCILLKNWFERPRPQLVPHLSFVSTASFPSGHSLFSAVVYLTLAALLARVVESKKFKLYFIFVALLFTFLVGLSRVYLGVHYPTDVLAGWSIGLMWAVMCWLVARFLQRRGTVERPK